MRSTDWPAGPVPVVLPAPAPARPIQPVGAIGLLVPIDISGWAMAAGYLGLFALVILPAPVALIIGLVALRDLDRRPQMRGRGRAWFGIITGAIGTTLIGIGVILAATGH